MEKTYLQSDVDIELRSNGTGEGEYSGAKFSIKCTNTVISNVDKVYLTVEGELNEVPFFISQIVTLETIPENHQFDLAGVFFGDSTFLETAIVMTGATVQYTAK